MSEYTFDKDTILSRPIKDENDLACVIVEMRKAIGFLLDEVVDLRRTVNRQEGELHFLKGRSVAEELAGRYRRATTAPMPTAFPGLRTGGGYSASLSTAVTASQIRERMDMMVHPPIVTDRYEGTMKEYKP